MDPSKWERVNIFEERSKNKQENARQGNAHPCKSLYFAIFDQVWNPMHIYRTTKDWIRCLRENKE